MGKSNRAQIEKMSNFGVNGLIEQEINMLTVGVISTSSCRWSTELTPQHESEESSYMANTESSCAKVRS
jgi:hypothetical protein